jgi:hypothetical protein
LDLTQLYQDALRMLFLLDAAGLPPGSGDDVPVGAVTVIESEVKVQKLHFWMRNPDYLAAEILTRIRDGALDKSWLDTAELLIEGDEPDLRRYPMMRYKFGAFEPLDDAFAILVTAGLARTVRSAVKGQRDFYLLDLGRTKATEIVHDIPDLVWYPDRAKLVAEVAGDASGSKLRDRQYEVAEYAQTAWNNRIASIVDLVREEVQQMRAAS